MDDEVETFLGGAVHDSFACLVDGDVRQLSLVEVCLEGEFVVICEMVRNSLAPQ